MTRNLIDLGLQFSHGRFQTNLLKQAQKMLQDQQSAYYDLVKDLSATVDHDIIATFGVNLGYNSCTKGAVVIRDIEDEKSSTFPGLCMYLLTKKSWKHSRISILLCCSRQ